MKLIELPIDLFLFVSVFWGFCLYLHFHFQCLDFSLFFLPQKKQKLLQLF